MLERRTGMKGKDIPADSPVWDLEAFYIAEALVNYTMCYSVERIVLGGGVMDNKFLFPMIRNYYSDCCRVTSTCHRSRTPTHTLFPQGSREIRAS